MDIPINLFMWTMAFLPIIVLLVLMLRLNWGAAEAAPVGLLVTVLTGVLFYKADIRLIAAESAKGIWNALVILAIVWIAILMYQAGNEAKAFPVIRNGMRKLLPNELLLVLAMGWCFEGFLQGITGFGVPVAVGAPLLIGIGVKPMWAVIIPLIGQSWGNTFGTLGAAWDALAMSAGLIEGSGEYYVTAFWTAAFIWFWNVIEGFAICWFYGKGKAVKKGLPAVLITSAIQGGGELWLSQVNTTICCFVPACVSMLAILLLGRTKSYRDEWAVENSAIMNCKAGEEKRDDETPADMSLLQAFVPYFVLTALALLVLLIEPIHSVLGKISFGLSFPETSTGYGYVNVSVEKYAPFTPFTHASMFLLVAAAVGLMYYKRHGWMEQGAVKRVLVKSVSMSMPPGIAVMGLIMMSRIMDGTGQTIVLANGTANVLGKAYVVLAPFVGLLGSFMTGSNMSSNILFGGFQMTTASILEVNAAAVLGAHSAGGAIGSAISPSNMILGATTAGMIGEEGKLLKKILKVTVPAVLVMGILLYVLVIF